jgi:hypothetical protein
MIESIIFDTTGLDSINDGFQVGIGLFNSMISGILSFFQLISQTFRHI